jgi:hypothetical protein
MRELGLDSFDSGQGSVTGFCEHDNERRDSQEAKKILSPERLSACLFRQVSYERKTLHCGVSSEKCLRDEFVISSRKERALQNSLYTLHYLFQRQVMNSVRCSSSN